MSGSTQWPSWVCKNSCGAGPFPPDTAHVHCPGINSDGCGSPLVRWMRYQEKQEGEVYAPAPARRGNPAREHAMATGQIKPGESQG